MGRLLLACATTKGAPIDQDLIDATGPLIERLPLAAERHGIAMASAVALAHCDMPDVVRLQLAGRLRVGVTRQALLSLELSRLGAALDRASITWVAVKGPTVAERFYPRADLRSYVDLDLLVARAEYGDALAVLQKAGGSFVERDWDDVLHLFKGELNLKFPSMVVADVHWSLLYDQVLRDEFRWDDRALLGRRQLAALGGGLRVPVLDDIDCFVHLAVHACLAGGQRLCWMRDLQLVGAALAESWQVVLDRARTWKIDLVVGVMMERVRRVLGAVPWPRDIEEALVSGRGWDLAVRGFDGIRQPQRWLGGSLSGHLLVASTRETTSASLRTLRRRGADELRVLRTEADHPWRRVLPEKVNRRVATVPRPVSPERPDFLRAYLEAVAASE